MYKEILCDYIKSNYIIKEKIMFKDKCFRNDLDFDEYVNLDEVFASILDGRDLSYFNKRARDILIFEVMNMYNIYGMENLKNNYEIIAKEINYGIYFSKSNKSVEKFDEIMRLGDKYGKDAIIYLQNLDLLKERVHSLFNVSPNELLPSLNELYNIIEQCLLARDNCESKLTLDLIFLKSLYEKYEYMNKVIIKYLMSGSISQYISNPTGQLLMLHFIQDEQENNTDISMNDFLNEEILSASKKMICEITGRPYDEILDKRKLENILLQYNNSRKNPFDFKSRIPLRSKYVGKRSLFSTITKPMTLLSVSLSTPEYLNSHLDRKIAIGFIPDDIPIDAIISTCSVFNSEKDKYDFKKDSCSIVEIMEKNKINTRANETLLDWTKIKPGYIFVIKDKEELDPEIKKRVKELQQKNNLPVIVYDQYLLNKQKEEFKRKI